MLDERDIEILQEMFDRSYTRFEDSIIAELRSVREDLEKHLDKIGSDLEGMIQDLERISVTARENKVELQRLCDRIEINSDDVQPDLVINTVAEHYGISVEDICGSGSEFEKPRHIAMYLCRMMTNLPLGSIGELLGGNDRSATMRGINKVLEEIGFFRLVATIDEPSLPETAYLTGLTFMVGGMAVNACGIYGVYSGQGSGRSIMIATLTLIEALVLYSMAGGLIKSPAVKRVVAIMYRVAAVLLIALGVGLMAKEQFSERTVILGTMLLIEAVCLWKIKFEKAQFKEGVSG